jgi:hypothetical protein
MTRLGFFDRDRLFEPSFNGDSTHCLRLLPSDKFAQQIRICEHAHKPILIIRNRETTYVPAKHQLGRFLRVVSGFTEIGSNTASAINRVNLPSLGENKTGIAVLRKCSG